MATTQLTAVGAAAAVALNGTPTGSRAAGSSSIVLTNLGTAAVFIGGSNVTATTGIQIAAGANLVLPAVDGGAPIYVVLGVF